MLLFNNELPKNTNFILISGNKNVLITPRTSKKKNTLLIFLWVIEKSHLFLNNYAFSLLKTKKLPVQVLKVNQLTRATNNF